MRTQEQATQQIADLRQQLNHHNYLYYVCARPEISDRDYDKLYKQLEALEHDFPNLVSTDSPTQRVGGEPLTSFAHVEHAQPMLSLDNTYSRDEVADFDRRIARLLSNRDYSYVMEPKVDGVAISLLYRDGRLERAATRGNGRVGDDITANVRTIKSIPLRLRSEDGAPPSLLEVRGEIYMTKEGFQRINDKQQEAGHEPFANPRNAAAGSLKQLNPRVVAQRPLAAVLYGVGTVTGEGYATHAGMLQALRRLGLPTVPRYWHLAAIETVLAALSELESLRHSFAFEMDGAVIKVDERDLYELLGETAKSPRWAVAYKYEPERAETVLHDITIQVGRTGVLTPVAELDPTLLAGSTIRRATLHNQNEIARKDIRIGDHVVIEKAGEVIPAVVDVLTRKRNGSEMPFTMPEECPACGGAVVQKEGEVALRCDNLLCPAQSIRRLEYFAARGAMDIDGIGGIVAESLVERGLVEEPLDLFALTHQQLATLNLGTEDQPRIFGSKNAEKVLAALKRARSAPLSDWLFALGIARVGKTLAYQVAQVHRDLQDLSDSCCLRQLLSLFERLELMKELNPRARMNSQKSDSEKAELASRRDGVAVEVQALADQLLPLQLIRLKAGSTSQEYVTAGIGPEVTRQIVDYFDSESGKAVLERMRKLKINPQGGMGTPPGTGQSLTGNTFVLTGTLSAVTRDQAAAMIRECGGSVTTTVSGNTDYVVAGDSPGSKLKKAETLGVPVLSETAFLEMVDTNRPPGTDSGETPPDTPKQLSLL